MEGIRVSRTALYPSHDHSVLGRILNYASFALSSAIFAMTLPRPDVVYVYCPPMTASAGAVALRVLRRVPFVIDIQDLWPDTLASTGMVRSGVLLRLVGAWSHFAMRLATQLVVLSRGFKNRLEEQGVKIPIHVIPNWAPHEIVEQAKALPQAPGASDGTLNILFAGNMGKAQALDIVIKAAERLKYEAPSIRFTMVGGGVELENLRRASELAQTSNIRFLPQRNVEEMGSVFAEADALLLHLRDDPLFEITIPSKTQAYLAIGRPILMGVVGDAAVMVEAAGAGIQFAPDDADALVDAAIHLSTMSHHERQAMGLNGAAYYREHLSFDIGVDTLEAVLINAAMEGP